MGMGASGGFRRASVPRRLCRCGRLDAVRHVHLAWAGALGIGRFGAVVGGGDISGTDLSAFERALVQCGDQAGDRPVDSPAGLAGAGADQAVPAG
ncbi:hypothetical protein D9M71_606230 [compost metagenome]